jgi:Ca-activated chloride channel family protein
MKIFDGFFQLIKTVEFVHPHAFWLLLLLVPFLVWQIWKQHKMQTALTISSVAPFENAPRTWRTRLRHLPMILRALTFALLIVCIARPQSTFRNKNIETEGIDIVIALDISGSMQMMDFSPNRLEACKEIAAEFVDARPTDRLGLVVYAGEAYTQCPLTSDHETFQRLLHEVKFGLIDDGTAIGDGLGTAINRLRESKAKSKVIILLTDGVNNAGYMDPHSAAEMAKELGIKVYTISCGTNGKMSKMQVHGNVFTVKTEIDEALLKHIATQTDGKYFTANNNKKLRAIYNEIDQMEKSVVSEDIMIHKSDEFLPFLVLALICFILEIITRYFILRTNP